MQSNTQSIPSPVLTHSISLHLLYQRAPYVLCAILLCCPHQKALHQHALHHFLFEVTELSAKPQPLANVTFYFCPIKSALSKKPSNTVFHFHFLIFLTSTFFCFVFLQRYNRTTLEVICGVPCPSPPTLAVWMNISPSCHNGNRFPVFSEMAVEAALVKLLKMYLHRRLLPFKADR